MLLIPLAVFWVVVIRLWYLDGPKLPLIFIGIWLLAFFGPRLLNWPNVAGVVIQCFLAAILLAVERYKSAL